VTSLATHNRFARHAVGKLLLEDDGEPAGMAADRQAGHCIAIAGCEGAIMADVFAGRFINHRIV
jgi:hypothetical protein